MFWATSAACAATHAVQALKGLHCGLAASLLQVQSNHAILAKMAWKLRLPEAPTAVSIAGSAARAAGAPSLNGLALSGAVLCKPSSAQLQR